MTMQLKNVTTGPRGCKATIAVGHARTTLDAGSANAETYNRVIYASSGLVLAAFPHTSQSRCIVAAAHGPITIVKCSSNGDTLVTGIMNAFKTFLGRSIRSVVAFFLNERACHLDAACHGH